MAWRNSVMLSDSIAPAVGKNFGFSIPMAARKRLNTFLSKYLYSFSSSIGTFLPRRLYFISRFLPTAIARLKSNFTTGDAWSMLLVMAVYTFSQNRGTEHMQVGFTSFTAF